MLEPYRLKVRFSDCDMMQHVNNAVYLNYFEEARIHYFHQMVGIHWDWYNNGMILRKNELEYLKPILLNELVEITVSRKHIGEKSFTLCYEVTVNGTLCCTGTSVLVAYSNALKQSIRIPDAMRESLLLLPETTE